MLTDFIKWGQINGDPRTEQRHAQLAAGFSGDGIITVLYFITVPYIVEVICHYSIFQIVRNRTCSLKETQECHFPSLVARFKILNTGEILAHASFIVDLLRMYRVNNSFLSPNQISVMLSVVCTTR